MAGCARKLSSDHDGDRCRVSAIDLEVVERSPLDGTAGCRNGGHMSKEASCSWPGGRGRACGGEARHGGPQRRGLGCAGRRRLGCLRAPGRCHTCRETLRRQQCLPRHHHDAHWCSLDASRQCRVDRLAGGGAVGDRRGVGCVNLTDLLCQWTTACGVEGGVWWGGSVGSGRGVDSVGKEGGRCGVGRSGRLRRRLC